MTGLSPRANPAADRPGAAGFTLIELMVVVLIMGILMAIAIPAFLTTTNGAHKAGATSDLTNVLIDVKAYYDDHGSGFGSTAKDLETDLASAEAAYTFTTGKPAEGGGVSVHVANSSNGTYQEVVLGAQADTTDTCYYIDDLEAATGTASVAGPQGPVIEYGELTGKASGTCPAAASKKTTWDGSESVGWAG